MSEKKKKIIVVPLDPIAIKKLQEDEKALEKQEKSSVVFSILDELKKSQYVYGDKKSDQYRLAFESDPAKQSGVYESLYRHKVWLLPDSLIKKIHRSDDLIAAILNARGNHLGAFGRPRESRFDLGFDIIVDKKHTEGKSEEELEKLTERVDRAKKIFFNCGHETGWDEQKKMNLSQFLKMFTMDGLRFGRGAVEIIFKKGDPTQFHSFRPVDSGTIYQIAPFAKKSSADALRAQSKALLERLRGDKIPKEQFDVDKYVQDEYTWVQVIDNIPRQAFKSKQLVVHNFYPITDVEYAGYPLTPLDTIINAVTTHMNIQQHNKLYFQSGRAARGMLVVQSDSVDEGAIQKIRLQFNASINAVTNAHRMPVFGIGSEDSINWQPLDASGAGRDKEFQILSDSNARSILAAYQMSPDELPGYGHLSKATAEQSLSESNNEYKLQAARDVGIRPLIMGVQDFLNDRVFPLVDKELSNISCLVLQGLDADDPIKESEKFEAGMNTHYSYNDILEIVDKKKIEEEFGGDFPLNPRFTEVLDKYLTVGQILERFFGIDGAAEDETLSYRRDAFWMQQKQMELEAKQLEVQAQMQQQQMQMQQEQMQQQAQIQEQTAAPEGAEGAPEGEGGEGSNLSAGIDQLMGMLSKSESQMAPNQKRLLAQQRAVVNKVLNLWEAESQQFFKEILDDAKKFTRKSRTKGKK